ncbi:UDP-4-amino-4,6-dideoxy-N-acetyl-beta-L-altrosamine N-acetyltransferase [Providencia stuartii]|uniref:UDP-4-amino-4, 6-dideoxy-N-acetyl-beta-L-altrosamine N-acetyltransferase n=1 Tax=Providencia stuartii TaxID=588 RepID=UPI0034E49F6D
MTRKNIELVPLEQKNLEMILSWRNAPEVRKNMYTSHEITQKEHESWFERMVIDETKRYFIAKLNNESIGVVGFYNINKTTKIADWAFYASPKAPRGSGALMEYIALEYAFSSLNLYKLKCEVLGFNSSVVKLHTKFGFQIEGKHRDAFYDGDKYHDIIHLGLFSNEWFSIKEVLKTKLKLN